MRTTRVRIDAGDRSTSLKGGSIRRGRMGRRAFRGPADESHKTGLAWRRAMAFCTRVPAHAHARDTLANTATSQGQTFPWN